VKIPTLQQSGSVEIYNDFSATGNTSINTNWVNRNFMYFQQSLTWGDTQAQQYGLAKIDYVSQLRDAMMMTLSQFQNDFGFQGATEILGVANELIQTYGIFTEPNLPAAISLPALGFIPGTNIPTAQWSGTSFAGVLLHIKLLVNDVITKTFGQVTLDHKFTLVIPPSASIGLIQQTDFGITVSEQLRKEFPNMEVVTCPNFESQFVTDGSTPTTAVMLLADAPDGSKPFKELFVTKLQNHRAVPMASSVSEKISYILGGVVLDYPAFVSWGYGV
jgi:hypothetical protein